MGETSEALLTHSIAVAMTVTIVFALTGLTLGWNKRRTSYAVWFAVLGGLSAFGIISAAVLGGF